MPLVIEYDTYLEIWQDMMSELDETNNPPTKDEANMLRNMLFFVFGDGVEFEGKMARAVRNPWDVFRAMIISCMAVIDEHLDKIDQPDVVAFTKPKIEKIMEHALP
jgi:hypothetical protein